MSRPPETGPIRGLTKAEMDNLASLMGHALPVSWNKARTKQELAHLYEHHAHDLTIWMSPKAADLFRRLSESDLETGIKNLRVSSDEHHLEYLLWQELARFGLVGSDGLGGRFVSPLVRLFAQSVRPEDDEERGFLQFLAECITSILLTYGLLPEEELLRILRAEFRELSPQLLASLLRNNLMLQRTLLRIDVEGEAEDDWQPWHYLCTLYDDVEHWLDEMHVVRSFPYAQYRLEEHIHLSSTGFLKETPAQRELLKLLYRAGIHKNEAKELLADAILTVRHQLDVSGENIAGWMIPIDWHSEKDFERAVALWSQIYNASPLWINKGHSPDAMVALYQKHAPKVVPFPGKPKPPPFA